MIIKKTIFTPILIISSALLFLAFCCEGPGKELHTFDRISIEDSIIIDNDSIELRLKITIPEKYKMYNTYIEIMPVLINSSSDSIRFKLYKVQGEKVKDNYNIIPYQEGKIIQYADQMELMNNDSISELIFDVIFICNGKNKKSINQQYCIRKY